ncbi:hypothetical protein FACS189485_13670 [Spirochaetia bacterium]|nr:hypothetical protein FACS189485_13670 [Spirochaetia bacterium]
MNAYGVVFPDFPGLTTVGDNYHLAHEALAFHVEGLSEDGNKLPEPRTLAEIKVGWEDWSEWEGNDYIVASITLLPPYGTQKIL